MAVTLAQRQAAKPVIKLAEVVREGEKIILPTKMTNSEAIAHLQRLIKQDEEVVTPSQTFDAFPWDGAHALTLALNNLFGWYSLEKTPGFFGPNPPEMKTVETGPDTTVQVPWGRFSIPQIPYSEGYLQTGTTTKNNRLVFQLTASMRRKYEPIFQQICEEIKRQLDAHSLYKGKAFKIKFNADNGTALPIPEISFIRLSQDAVDNLVLSKRVTEQVVTNVFTPIEKHMLLKKLGLRFKRGVLFYGKFGVGKTMISTATAIKCTANGITFVLCTRAEEFSQAMEFARQYAKAVVFCEDIDRVTSGPRTEALDNILNTIDGVEAKRAEVMAVVTTNDVDAVNQAMLRPGRLDAVFEVTPPDAEAVQRLIKVYAGKELDPKADLVPVGKALCGQVPAVIQECVNRSKYYALAQAVHPDDIKITGEALLAAVDGMQDHLERLNGTQAKEVHPTVMAAQVIGRHLSEALRHAGIGIRTLTPEFAKLVDAEVKELVSARKDED